VLVAGMVPRPGEQALAHRRGQSDTPGLGTAAALCQARDRHPRDHRSAGPIPSSRVASDVIRDRLGITPDELDSGHCPALRRPRELAGLLDGCLAEERQLRAQTA